ncbi:MAG: enoyl-CoA hydratase/isomerase family protein [Gemmatimonadota bacterium]
MAELVTVRPPDGSGVRRLVLNRPERRNALNAALVGDLSSALTEAGSDPDARVVTLEGAGPDFCAGADLAEVQAAVEAGIVESLRDAERLGELFLQMRRIEKPLVALVTGRALAGGCGLATACDLVLASSSAEFGYPEVRLGFVPAMVMAILRRSLGEKRAFELIALGDRIGADEAERMGLVNRVFPAETFAERADAYVTELARRSASALAMAKRLFVRTDGADFETAIRAGAQVNALARLTDDCQAGIRRFLDR